MIRAGSLFEQVRAQRCALTSQETRLMRIVPSALSVIAVVVTGAVASHASEVAIQSASPSTSLCQTAPALDVGQQSARIAREVRDSLGGERDLRDIEVSVERGAVTLGGRVETFWAKDQAIRRTLAVEGVESIVSDLEIPLAEDDGSLARDVARAIQGYTYYTVWDQIDGSVTDGAVSLFGLVTPDRDKIDEIFERVAKVKGVQDVRSEIRRLPELQRDHELRRALANRVFRSEHFERFSSMSNPPFHIIVDSSGVTLVGYVQSVIEAHEMQRIVAQTQGVTRVENQLEIAQR